MIKKEVNCTAAIVIQIALNKLYKDLKVYKIEESEYGFYIDFYVKDNVSINDFDKITKEMKRVIAGGHKIEYLDNNQQESKNFLKINHILKKYDLFKLNNNVYATYGKSLENVNKIKYVILTQFGGVEFEVDKKIIQLNRIFVSAFINEEDFIKFEEFMTELKSRDHRKIGADLEIFTFNEKVGQGFPIWLPNGAFIKEKISNYLKFFFATYNFKIISTPILGTKSLYVTSGHWDLYKDNNFPPINIDDDEFMLRPMTCPHHMLVFNSSPKSYRDLPYKICEDSKLHRYESSGGLIGLERVRSMELFDSHVFCSVEDIENVILELNQMIIETHKKLCISIDRIDLSLKSDEKNKYFNDLEMWDTSEEKLRNILKKMDYKYHEIKGEAAFYGPKIDYQYKTNLGKFITISTIQLDFLLPKKFDCLYKDKDGELKTPVLIHFGVIGTYERFISLLLSQTKGVLPFWLVPIQFVIIPINNNFHLEYSRKIAKELIKYNFNIKIDDSEERLSKKIRNWQTSKVPVQIIIGDNEVKSNNEISYRKYGQKDTSVITIKKFIEIFKNIN